jgi:hypothetical protein
LSKQFQKAEAANRILKIPTGDGMAISACKSGWGFTAGRSVVWWT